MNYTPQQYAKHLDSNLDKLLAAKSEWQEAVYALVSKVDDRIFDAGKDKNGATIGTYSTNELYVNPTSPMNRKGFPVKGKDGSSTFKNGKKRKTSYFSTYTAYKIAQGVNTLGGKVNLQITKHFRRAFLTKTFPLTKSGSKLSFSLGVKPSTANPIGKLEGIMQDRYPKAFKFNKEERAFILAEFKMIFIKGLKK